MAKPKADRKAKVKPEAKKPKATAKPRAKAESTGAPKAEKRDNKGKFADGHAGGPGRTPIYTDEIAASICERLAAGETLISICRDEFMPAESTVRSWALDPDHPFCAKYEAARKVGYMRMADELIDIMDDGRNDWMERRNSDGESSGWQVNGEHVQRSRLRVEGRKWILSKALPKIFGDKVALTDAEGGKLVIEFAQ